MEKLLVGDEVIVLTGRDKGSKGKIVEKIGEKLVVGGVNLVKKHVKPNPAKGVAGGIVEKPMPIDRSNVAIVNRSSGKADYVRIAVAQDGKRTRVYRSTGDTITS